MSRIKKRWCFKPPCYFRDYKRPVIAARSLTKTTEIRSRHNIFIAFRVSDIERARKGISRSQTDSRSVSRNSGKLFLFWNSCTSHDKMTRCCFALELKITPLQASNAQHNDHVKITITKSHTFLCFTFITKVCGESSRTMGKERKHIFSDRQRIDERQIISQSKHQRP